MIIKVLCLSLVLVTIKATQMTIALQSYEKQCFYQILQSQQKYSIDVVPKIGGKYEVEVTNMLQGKWNSVYYKQTQNGFEHLNIHKLTTEQSTYSYCFRNVDQDRIQLKINMQSGLQLMEFEMLPDKSDSENLERELSWLQGQKNKLFQSLDRMQGLRASSRQLANLMSTKMIGFAVVGLLAIVIVNILFYKQLKKTFKDRKLI